MRPINLIPPHERRGSQAPLRSGPLVYVLVGALVLVLAGVTAMVLTGNQVSEKEGEVATLASEDATAKAEAEKLASYVTFQTTSEQRVATVQSLANSRFDWERVMRELALILPSDIWLLELNASASGEASGGGGSGGSLRGSIAGPALELEGCAEDQDAVAGFVRALKDIDGVTRVGLESSELGKEEETTSTEVTSASNEPATSSECRPDMAKFEITIAFDAAPVADLEAEAEAAAAAPTAGSTETTESSGTAETTSTESSGSGE
ncbi:MAG TPA: PilN domain-containing protein [Solirubrobacterales bacterium]|jgi:Tfp pilus assembly protein PilN